MREPYRPGDDLVGHLRSAIHEESAAIAPQTSALIELARIAADEIERLRAKRLRTAAPSYRAAVLKELEAENERLRTAMEQAASIVFNGVEEEGYPGLIDRRPETLRSAILALV
jgi:hypothetical protein